MPQVISKIGIKNSSGTGFDTRDIGAKAQNVTVDYTSTNQVITDGTTPSSTKSVAEVVKSLENSVNGKAPVNHQWTSGTDYGKADGTHYGHIKVGTGLTCNDGVVGVSYGASAGTACQGNDGRLADARKNPNAVTFTNGSTQVIYDGSAAKTVTADTVGAAPSGHTTIAATTSRLGHVKVGTGLNVDSAGQISANFGASAGQICQGNDGRLTNSRTPVAHASTSTNFGGGTSSQYGHVKLSDDFDINSPSLTTNGAAVSVGASAYALQQAYKNLKHNIVEYKNITNDFNSGTFSENIADYSPGNYITIKDPNYNLYFTAVLCHYNYWFGEALADTSRSATIGVPHWVAIVLGFASGYMAEDSSFRLSEGFKSTEMYTWLTTTTVSAAPTQVLKRVFGEDHLIAHHCYLTGGTYDATKLPAYGFKSEWSDKLFAMIPSIEQLGCSSDISIGLGSSEACRPLKLFQEDSFMNVLEKNYGQSNRNFKTEYAWCRNISRSEPTRAFCRVNSAGCVGANLVNTKLGRYPLIILK